MENQQEPIDIAIKWIKIVTLWLFWLLFFILFDLELTLVCLMLLLITKQGQKVKKIDKHVFNDYKMPDGEWNKPYYVKIDDCYKHLYAGMIVCYVYALIKDKDTGKTKKEIMGPYNRTSADSLVVQLLAEGHCSWVEEGPVR